MSCYHPYIGFKTGKKTVNGKDEIVLRPASYSRNPLIELKENDSVLIPCGKCVGCRLDRARQWSDRMMLELDTMKKGLFVTLTYSPENVPCVYDDEGNFIFYTLRKSDAQKFMKDLRSHFEGVRVRFYLSGEYGEHTLRPHMHVILFGLGIDDFPDLELYGYNELNQKYYISKTMEKIWKKGFCMLSDVSYETCAYVARYVQKKLGDSSIPWEELGVQREFSLMSRRPGIGKEYLDQHPDCLDYTCVNLSTFDGGRKIYIPKYYLRKLELTDPEKYAILLEKRKKFASDKMLLELGQTNLGFSEYLLEKEDSFLEHIKVLKRQTV